MSLYLLLTICFVLDIIRTNNPNILYYLEQLLFEISYNCIYMYSKAEIWLNKMMKCLPISITNVDNMVSIEIYKEGEMRFQMDANDGTIDLNIVKELYNIEECELLVYTHNKNKVCFNSCPQTLEYRVSSIRFISIELIYVQEEDEVNVIVPIDLTNYYVVNNCLNKEFFIYYVKNVLRKNIISYNGFKYTCTILDNNADLIDFNEKTNVTILEHGYNIEYNIKDTIDINDNNRKLSDDFIKLEE